MQVSIDAVRAANKVAEVCICYTGDVLHSKIYNLDYYKDVADKAVKAGAHMLGEQAAPGSAGGGSSVGCFFWPVPTAELT